MSQFSPNWLQKLERKVGWIEIPQIGILLVTLQILGFLIVKMTGDDDWLLRLALIPSAVIELELWRVVTWLALPLSLSPFWMIFALWFLYFIANSLESEWGSFKTTFYILASIVVTVAYSLILGYPIGTAANFESSLFLAAAMLFPEYEIRLFLVIPVKMKWLGLLTAAFVAYSFIVGDWYDRGYLIAVYSMFLLFFGPGAWQNVQLWRRRQKYKAQLRGD